MTNFIGIVHIIVALVLIVLVLIQDSKSDGALGIGGSSGSNSLLGATGAQTLASKLTVWSAIIFACTCLALSVLTSAQSKSVIDTLPAPVTAPAVPAAQTAPATTESAAPAQTAPANSETTAPATK